MREEPTEEGSSPGISISGNKKRKVGGKMDIADEVSYQPVVTDL